MAFETSVQHQQEYIRLGTDVANSFQGFQDAERRANKCMQEAEDIVLQNADREAIDKANTELDNALVSYHNALQHLADTPAQTLEDILVKMQVWRSGVDTNDASPMEQLMIETCGDIERFIESAS
ncbi:MAG: hypothetical protein AAF950_14375 [Pseudomonadota bacterium]